MWYSREISKKLLSLLISVVISLEVAIVGGNKDILSLSFSLMIIASAFLFVIFTKPNSVFIREIMCPVIFYMLAIFWPVAAKYFDGEYGITNSYREYFRIVSPQLVDVFAIIVLFLMASFLGFRRKTINYVVNYTLALSFVNLLIGLLLRESNPNEIWGIARPVGGDRFSGTLLNANVAACLFGIYALLALGQVQAAGRARVDMPVSKIFAALMLFANIGACVATGSRTAITLLVVGGLLQVVRPARMRYSSRTLTLVALSSAVGVTIFYLAGEIVLQRFLNLDGDAVSRWAIWRHYWSVICHAPIYGFGLGSFSDVNLHFLGDVNEAAMFWYINDAHNLFLRILIEGGWPYLLLLMITFGFVSYRIYCERKVILDAPIHRAMMVALAFALGCGMTDIALSVPAVISLCAVLAGLLWGRAIRIRSDRKANDPVPPLVPQ